MAAILRANGVDLRELGMIVQRMPTLENPPKRRVVTADSPFEYGEYFVRLEGAGPRVLPIEAALVKDTVANRIAAVDRIKALFGRGLIRLERDFAGTTRVIDGYLDGDPTVETSRSTRSPIALLRWSMVCPAGLWREPLGTRIGGTGKLSLPLGTGPVLMIFRLPGRGATGTGIVVRDAWGNILHQIILPANATSTTEFIDIDCRVRRGVEKVSGSTRTSLLGNVTFTGRFPFALDSSYGDPTVSLFPTVEETGGNQMEALYVKTYL